MAEQKSVPEESRLTHERDESATMIHHPSRDPSMLGDEQEDFTVDLSHHRDITSVFEYDTSTLNKGFQNEMITVFSQFQDDLHEKQSIIDELHKANKELTMQISALQMNLQEINKDKKQWRTQTISSVRDMVSQQNTDMIIDNLTQKFQLDAHNTALSIDELAQKIELKYNNNQNAKYMLLFTFGIGITIGYVFKDRIKSIFGP
eukprot:379210_1